MTDEIKKDSTAQEEIPEETPAKKFYDDQALQDACQVAKDTILNAMGHVHPEGEQTIPDETGLVIALLYPKDEIHESIGLMIGGGPSKLLKIIQHMLRSYKCRSMEDLVRLVIMERIQTGASSSDVVNDLLGIGMPMQSLSSLMDGLNRPDPLKALKQQILGCHGDCDNCDPEYKEQIHNRKAHQAMDQSEETSDDPINESDTGSESSPAEEGVGSPD